MRTRTGLHIHCRAVPVGAAALLVAGAATAHDFWIEPQAFAAAPGSRVGLELKVGHGTERMRSQLPASRFVRLQAIGAGPGAGRAGVEWRPGGGADDGWVASMATGGLLLALETDASATSRLDAARFEAYARDEGLTEVLAHRERSGQAMRAGTERYSRHAKALVSDVCAHPGSTGLAQRVLGLRLEIVPMGEPVAPPVGEPLGVRLLFDARPLAGAQVRRVSLEAAPRADERGMTDSQGVAWFPSAHAGPWMLAAVWSRPLAPPAPVAYETFFASFTYASRTGEVPACELPK